MKRKRCAYCGKLTHDWERVNGGPYLCWDCGRKIRDIEAKLKKEEPTFYGSSKPVRSGKVV